jgi:hypothetical protein
MNKKYQVFISSTFSDLIEERQDTIRSVLDLGHIPSGMEVFPAADVEQFEYIKKIVDECDYYVLIIGARYGSTDTAGVSFTEKEYDYAVERKKTVLAFIHGDPGSVAVAKADIDPALAAKLTAFRKKVSTGRLVQFWTSRENLKSKVIVALSKAFSDVPGIGWIRGDAAASEDLLAQINGLRNLVDKLNAENEQLTQQSRPNLEGIAGLDEQFNVRFSFQYFNKLSGKWEESHLAAPLTWAEIFAAVGPFVMQPASPATISTSVRRYVQENKQIKRQSMAIFSTDENRIKLHLMALGLIDSTAAEARGGGVSEFVSITPRGRQQLLEILAVRPILPLPEN